MSNNPKDSAAILAEIMKRTVGNAKIQAKQRQLVDKHKAAQGVEGPLTDLMKQKISEYDAKEARH